MLIHFPVVHFLDKKTVSGEMMTEQVEKEENDIDLHHTAIPLNALTL